MPVDIYFTYIKFIELFI